MKINEEQINSQKNRQLYEEYYGKVDIDGIINNLNNFDKFFNNAKITHTSWVGFYRNDFDKDLKGKRVLELGCGDCENAAIMSYLGAEVYALDIAQASGAIIEKLNQNYDFEKPLQFIFGDFLEADIPEDFFDYVVGKAFVHHLTPEQEILYTEKIVSILKKDGVVRYFEPAVNSKFLDKIRFLIPLRDRPSSLQKKKFKAWKESDPHPERDNSSASYRKIGEKYFVETRIYCIGSIEKFHRLFPRGVNTKRFRQLAYRIEAKLPRFFQDAFARSQTVEYRIPKK